MQHTATHCTTLQHTRDMCGVAQMAAANNTLQHNATHCTTLQHIRDMCGVAQMAAARGFQLQGREWRHLSAAGSTVQAEGAVF